MLWKYADNITTFYTDVEVTLSSPSPLPKTMTLELQSCLPDLPRLEMSAQEATEMIVS